MFKVEKRTAKHLAFIKRDYNTFLFADAAGGRVRVNKDLVCPSPKTGLSDINPGDAVLVTFSKDNYIKHKRMVAKKSTHVPKHKYIDANFKITSEFDGKYFGGVPIGTKYYYMGYKETPNLLDVVIFSEERGSKNIIGMVLNKSDNGEYIGVIKMEYVPDDKGLHKLVRSDSKERWDKVNRARVKYVIVR